MKATIAIAKFLSFGVVVSSLAGCAAETPDEQAGEGGAALSGSSDNQHTAYTFFVGKGLSNIQSAGIVGNLMQESSVNPASVQKGGPGRGIAQWSAGARWDRSPKDNLKWFASTHGGSSSSLNTQLEFIWYELQNFPTYGLSSLKSATTISSAVTAFQNRFEVCGKCASANRIRDAQSVLNSFGGGSSSKKSEVASLSGADADGCFSSTLDQEVPANACVQSRADGAWYECDDGSWVARHSEANACNGEFKL